MPTPLLVKYSRKPAGESGELEVIDLGLVKYQKAYQLQKELLHKRKASLIGDKLILTEHLSVITIGRTGSRSNVFTDRLKVIKVDRGGNVTLHTSGQLVLYPIVKLTGLNRDLHFYLRSLENLIINFLSFYGIKGYTREGLRGVWVAGKKIASIGIGVSGWVSYHGLSINISPELDEFDQVLSCGIKDVKITSMEKVLGAKVNFIEAKNKLIELFKGTIT